MLMVAIILAAGKGTRLGALTQCIPKPLLLIANKRVIEYQIELLARYGVREIFIATDYLSEQFPKALGSGTKWNVKLHFYTVDSKLGPAGVIRQFQNVIHEDFLLLYGDILANFDVKRLFTFHTLHHSLLTLVVHPNRHPQDSDLLDMDQTQRVIRWYAKPHTKRYLRNLVNAGVYVLSPEIFAHIPPTGYTDFGHDLIPKLVAQKQAIYAYASAEYFHDMGTPERLTAVERDVKLGRFSHAHREVKQRAIFIDRDGVLIKLVDQLHQLRDVKLLPGAGPAIARINDSDYLVITITNQPMFARGLLHYAKWRQIQNKIDTFLARHNAKLDGVYFCPHHPDIYPGNIKKYNRMCDCRKPAIGLITQAVSDFNVDVSQSYFIGDSTVDIQTAKNARLRSVLVQTGCAGKDRKFAVQPDYTSANILAAVETILK